MIVDGYADEIFLVSFQLRNLCLRNGLHEYSRDRLPTVV